MASYFSLIPWPKVFHNLYEFGGIFLALGAVGFRYTSLRGHLGDGAAALYARMARRAAAIGFVGAALLMTHIVVALPRAASRAKLPVGEFLTTASPGSAWFYLTILALAGFAIAAAGLRAGWVIAAMGVVCGVLRNFALLKWGNTVTPIHVLTGGLWIGTLFVLVAAGLTVLLERGSTHDRRGDIVAEMVNAFSPLALVCGFVVVGFGVIAAFRELEPFSALWTTPYGYTLIAKIGVVGVVLALGAWNWRRQRPSLGTEAAAHSIQRSATLELAAALVVLMLTSVMLTMPMKK